MRNFYKFIFILVLISLISSVSAVQDCQTYDDFSSDNLDNLKWTEIHASNLNSLFSDEHYVNSTEEAYHTTQLTKKDAGTLLLMNKVLFPGDRVEYDVNYSSGEGNRIHIMEINGEYSLIGKFGFWNGIEPSGNEFGLYHVILDFDDNGANLTIIKPDDTLFTLRMNATAYYNLGFGTRTGDDGIVHMDYDNVKLCGNQQIPLVPEFGLIIGTLTLIGSIGIFFSLRR